MSLSDTALRLIQKNGEPGVLAVVTEGEYDEATGTTAKTTTTTDVSVYLMNYKTSLGDGATIRKAEGFLAGKAVTTAPLPGDLLTVAGIAWIIDEVDCIRAKGVAVLYIIAVRTS
jgi:hypothetical protein